MRALGAGDALGNKLNKAGCLVALAWLTAGLMAQASAQTWEPQDQHRAPVDRSTEPSKRSVAEWLVRLQQAAQLPSYVGTFVVSSPAGAMSSSRIWHASEDNVQLERVESLTGAPRSTFRHNETLVTFWPESRVVKLDQREARGTFPNLFNVRQDLAAADFYVVHEVGRGRVAGFESDIVVLNPRDTWRFGYRVWSEKRTGLVMKTQTLDSDGRVLEQAAFSELQLGVPVRMNELHQMMSNTQGYQVIKSERVSTTAEAEGWRLKTLVPGFQSQSCYRRALFPSGPLVQWIFTDGLATVSLFLEPFDARRHRYQGTSVMGATNALTTRWPDGAGSWWVTAVGEVPGMTLQAFVQGLQRQP